MHAPISPKRVLRANNDVILTQYCVNIGPIVSPYITRSKVFYFLNMENIILLASYALVGVLCLVASAFSFYVLLIAYVRWKYSHLPSPKSSRYIGVDKFVPHPMSATADAAWLHFSSLEGRVRYMERCA